MGFSTSLNYVQQTTRPGLDMKPMKPHMSKSQAKRAEISLVETNVNARRAERMGRHADSFTLGAAMARNCEVFTWETWRRNFWDLFLEPFLQH